MHNAPMRAVRRVLGAVWWRAAILLLALVAGVRHGSSAGARGPAALDVAPGHLPIEGELAFDVREAPSGEPIPCKLTLVGVDGHARPGVHARRHRPARRATRGRRVQPHHVADAGSAPRRAGRHVRRHREPRARNGTSRRAACKITRARARRCTARLAHVVDTHGWLSGDFHVHAARVARFARADAGSHLRVRRRRRADDRRRPITTSISDYEPYIHELGAGRSSPARSATSSPPAAGGTSARSRCRAIWSRRARARCWCTAATRTTSSATCARTRPTRSSTFTIRASTPRSATSTSASSTPRTDRGGAARLLLRLRRARGA